VRITRRALIGCGLAMAGVGLVAGRGEVAEAQIALPPPTADLRVEWDLGKDRRGNLLLSGYVYNARVGYYASAVHLRITGTDRTGRVVVDTTAHVYGDVLPQGRSYFEVRLASLEPTYRVTVTSVDFRSYGVGH
jgi:hypothetical protein